MHSKSEDTETMPKKKIYIRDEEVARTFNICETGWLEQERAKNIT